MKDYYALLGVTREASAREILEAYRNRVLACHPDRTGSSDSELFRRVREAYEVLSDPERRHVYDRDRETAVPVRIVSRPKPAVAATGPAIREVHRSSSAQFSPTFPGDPFDELLEVVRRMMRFR